MIGDERPMDGCRVELEQEIGRGRRVVGGGGEGEGEQGAGSAHRHRAPRTNDDLLTTNELHVAGHSYSLQ